MTRHDSGERTALIAKPVPPSQTSIATGSLDHSDHHSEDLTDPRNLSARTRWTILCAVWLGVFLGALDTTIVATLVSDVSSSFESSNQSSWLGSSYLLSTAVFTPLYGRLADIIGRRGASLLSVTLFTIGTAGCGLAPSMLSLIFARMVAGMGGGGMMAISSIVASDLIPLKRRALFQGLANLWFGAGAGLGGPLGGILADSKVGWRGAFLLQLPFLLLSLLLIFTFVRFKVPGQGKTKREMVRRIDYFGSLSLILSLGGLLFGLSYKNNESLPWTDPKVWASLIVAAVFAVVFVLVEAYVAPEPVLPLRILKQRNGFLSSLVNMFLSMVSFSVLYFFPMFFEVVKLQTASRAGMHLLPNSVALSAGSLFAGFMIRKTGKYSLLITISSFLPFVALLSMTFLDSNSGWFLQWLSITPCGFGFSSVLTSVLIALIASVDRTDMATATGISYLFRYIGQVVGVALSSSLLQSVLTAQLHDRITGEGAAETIDQIRHVSTSIITLPPHLREAAVASYTTGLRAVFILNACIAFLCFAFTLPIKQYPLHGSFEEEEAARRAADAERTRSA
ncbi:MFS general substrate transporter [Meredithblackwellia eburnea MCA 4105]